MNGIPQIMRIVSASTVLIISSVWDIRYRRIPNVITLPAILLGLVLTGIWQPRCLPFIVIALALLFFFGALHLMGQGDIKLLMALTAICGISAALISTGLAVLLIVGTELLLRPRETLRDTQNAIKALLKLDFKKINRDGRSVPFAPYMLAGFILYTVYQLFFL